MIKREKTTQEIIFLFQSKLNSHYPENEIRSILYQLFHSLMGWSRATVQLNRGQVLDNQVVSRLLDALKRLNAGEPVQYIIGSTEFCGLILNVRPGVLIPRPETEELAVMITRENQPVRNQPISILDMGTGSGCLALAMKKAFPDAIVTGIEKYPDALTIAKQNAVANQLEVTFIQGDILIPGSFDTPESFNIIVSNPPYIPDNEKKNMSSHVVDYEPGYALFVPDENPLLYYEAISKFTRDHLTPDGFLYVEIHENLGEDCVALFRAHGFKLVELLKDMYGKNRFIRVSKPF